MSEITQQYVQYIELMDILKFELAAEYLVMAATLAEIKSRMMLPKEQFDEEEEDPKLALIKDFKNIKGIKQPQKILQTFQGLIEIFLLLLQHCQNLK